MPEGRFPPAKCRVRTRANFGGKAPHERDPGHPRGTARRRKARRRRKAHRGAARPRQADRARAHRAFARQGLVRGARHVCRAPLGRIRHGKDKGAGRWRRHRLGHRQRPQDLCVRQGFYGVRGLALRDPCAKNRQDPGHGDEGEGADHRALRRRRRAHPGGRRGTGGLFLRVPPQCHRLRRDPADLGDHGALCRRRRLFAGDDLGGASVHATRSSIADGAFENDVETLLQMRRLIDFLPSNNTDGVPEWPSFDDIGRVDVSLDTLIPDHPNKPYDMKELILKVVDEGDFFEISETFAKNIVTGFGRIAGRTVGFVANQPMVLAGVLDSDASRKAARFVRFCDAFNIPIVTFVDVPGFLPGTAQEYGGLIKHGAKLLFAYSQCTVPLVTIITRKAYGGAFDVMASKEIGADMNYAWPTAQIAVMGAKGAVEIIFRSDIGDTDKIAARTREYEDRFLSPFVAAERGYIDDVIMPHSTRRRIARALAMLRDKTVEVPAKKHDNLPL